MVLFSTNHNLEESLWLVSLLAYIAKKYPLCKLGEGKIIWRLFMTDPSVME